MSVEHLLMVTPEEKERIGKLQRKSKEELKEDVGILKEWWGKQAHLPALTPVSSLHFDEKWDWDRYRRVLRKVFEQKIRNIPVFISDDDKLLTTIVVRNKYSIEKCKSKIEYYYYAPHVYPELFKDRQPLHPRIRNISRDVFVVTLPKLTPDFGRATIFSLALNDVNRDRESVYIRILTLIEFRMLYDQSVQEHSIVDMKNFTFNHLLNTNPLLFTKLITVMQGYSFNLGNVHIFNMPSFAQNLVHFVMTLLKAKFQSRIFFHEKMEDIFKHFPKEIIPKDYGGEEKSMEELNDEWIRMLESHNGFFEDMERRQSKEELRVGEPLCEEFVGIKGTFRQLNID